ncbi:MAG: intradiol ring-cleavage dioxygenase, partial [Acidobacteriota bacterium]
MTIKKDGGLLSRRETFRLMGGAGVVALTGWGGDRTRAPWIPVNWNGVVAASPLPGGLHSGLFSGSAVRVTRAVETLACVARPALTEGPYFVDELLNRSDIRPDPTNGTVKAGIPLQLNFSVNRVGGTSCAPLSGALVDIWHCDALGSYSDVANGGGQANTSGQKYLRGYQITDPNGAVQFTTIYPGYYTGRTVHIHFKIRLFSGSTKTYEFTSQLYFDDALTDQVLALAPYNTKAARGTRNSNDGIYNSQLLLSLTGNGQSGYVSSF